MTIIYYTKFEAEIPIALFEKRIDILPEHMAKSIRRFKRQRDALASLYGKLLLHRALKKFCPSNSLEDIEYTRYHKPYLSNGSASFNIAHSGNYVLCAVSDESDKVGIDIEEVNAIEVRDFLNIWTKEEELLVREGGIETFYYHWTRKEAVVKADGKGLITPLNMIDVRDDTVQLNGERFYLKTLSFDQNYFAHFASNGKASHLEFAEVCFSP